MFIVSELKIKKYKDFTPDQQELYNRLKILVEEKGKNMKDVASFKSILEVVITLAFALKVYYGILLMKGEVKDKNEI